VIILMVKFGPETANRFRITGGFFVTDSKWFQRCSLIHLIQPGTWYSNK